MSKGLEALKRIKPYADSSIDGELDIIEKELKEGENYKNYKEMYRLEHEKNQHLTQVNLKMLKELEIIKEHTLYCENVDCFVFANVTKEVNVLLKEILL